MADVTMWRCAVTFGVGLVVACGCVVERINTNHCAYLEGDATCEARYGAELGSCQRASCGSTVNGDGCVATRPDEDACYSPCGGGLSFPDDASCASGESTSTGESSTSGETTIGSESSSSGSGESSSTTGPMPCVSDEECTDVEAPFCGVSGECGTCSGTTDPDAACTGVDPGLPLCVGESCVACTPENPAACTGTTPVCDAATNSCVPCTAHEQCGEAACNLYTGACLPGEADAIAHVGPGQELASLSEAVLSVPAGGEGTVVVHQADFNEAVVVDGNRTVAFLAAEGDGPLWILAGGGSPQLTVTAGSTILMDGLQLSGNASDLGVRVDGGRAWVDRSRIIQNSSGGVLAENGAELTLRNCFVGGADNAAAVSVDGATARITFSTLGGGTITATGLSCTAPDAVEVRSSTIVALGIMATGGVDVACSVADISYTATEAPFAGTGNVAVGELPFMTPEDWFVDYGTGNYHLQNDGLTLFADVAQWSTGDPPTDIDGELRPNLDGSPDYAGADVPQ